MLIQQQRDLMKRKATIVQHYLYLGFVLVSLTGNLPARAQNTTYEFADLQALQDSFEQIASKVSPSVIAIRSDRIGSGRTAMDDPHTSRRGARTISHGSGIVLREDGYILTNEHVVGDCENISVFSQDGREYKAELVASDRRRDLAVIKIPVLGLVPAELGEADEVRKGHWAFAVGNPFGLGTDGKPAFTVGNVTKLGQSPDIDQTRYYGNLIETSAPINPGNSGGPLFNMAGEVIGIVTAIQTRSGASEGVGFAIPIDSQTRKIIRTLQAGKEVRYGYLGVRGTTRRSATSAGSAMPTAVITELAEGFSPAGRAGIQPGDIVERYGNTRVQDFDHLIRLVGATDPGTRIAVRVRRGSRLIKVQLVVGERPDDLT